MQLSDLFTAISILLGVIAYGYDKLIARRDATIAAMNGLISSYYDTIAHKENDSDYFNKCRRYLGEVDRVCIAVECHVYSKRIIKKYGSKFLVFLYDKMKEYVIDKTRRDFKDGTKYSSFEKIVAEFRKKQKSNK